MKKFLIPVDGSECALRAVSLAAQTRLDYADPDSVEIHLLNVQLPISHSVKRFFSHDEIASFLREESEHALAPARALLDAAGARYTCHAEFGNVAETIIHFAETLGCDQIIMGTNGRGALERLIGSATMKVLHLSKAPILLVK